MHDPEEEDEPEVEVVDEPEISFGGVVVRLARAAEATEDAKAATEVAPLGWP